MGLQVVLQLFNPSSHSSGHQGLLGQCIPDTVLVFVVVKLGPTGLALTLGMGKADVRARALMLAQNKPEPSAQLAS